MAGQTVTISVLADTKKFSSAMKKLSNESGLSRLGSAFKKAGKAVAIGAGAAAAGAVVVGKKLIEAGERASTSNARISNITESMGLFGKQAQVVSERVVGLSDKIARATGVDQNSIKVTAAKLLTFKELAKSADEVGGHFDRATKAAIDLAAAGFGNAETNAAQLGRALNDPIKGINALTRTGVVFTDAEKERIKAMVEAGDIASAQAVVLDALETQVGGTAEATANATDRMKVAWSQVQENLGQKLMPILEKFSTWFIDVALPAIETFAREVGSQLQPKLEALGAWFRQEGLPRLQALGSLVKDEILPRLQALGQWVSGTLVPALRNFGEWVVSNRDWLTALAVVVGTLVIGIQTYVKVMAIWRAAVAVATAVQVAFNAVMAANPIGLIILAIAGLVAGLTYFFTQTETGKKVWKGFTDFLGKAWDNIKRWAGVLWEWLKKVFGWTPVGIIVKNWDKITGFFGKVKDRIVDAFAQAWEFVKKVWSYTPIGLIVSNWDAILAFFRGIPDKVKAFFSSAVTWLKDAGSKVITGLLGGLRSGWDAATSWIGGIKDNVVGFFSGASQWLYDAGKNVVQGLLNGVGSLASTVGNWFLDRLPGWIQGPFKKALGIESPSRVFQGYGRNIVQGLVKGIRGDAKSARAASAELAKMAQKAFGRGDTRGGQHLRALSEQTKQLAGMRAALASANKALDEQREKLKALREERAAMREQVASSIRGELDLSTAIGQDTTDSLGRTTKGKTTFASVAGAVKAMAAKAKNFATRLKRLAAAGIPAGLIQEVAALGSDQGIQVADALLSGSATEIKQLRADFSALESWSQAAGKYVAAATYDTAIAAQQGLVKGLKADTKALKQAAKALAKTLAKAVKQELGIKSPSRVFAEMGRQTIDGLKLGMERRYGAAETSLRDFAHGLGQAEFKPATVPVQTAAVNKPEKAGNDLEASLTRAFVEALRANPIVARAYLDDREARKITQTGIQEIRRTDPAVLR